MKIIRIEKITLNIGTGEPGEKLEKARSLLTRITGSKPIECGAKSRIPTWGIRPGLHIAIKITLRGNKAKELLTRLLGAKGNKLKESNFDKFGNFSFGIPEYLDIPGVEYDMKIGIIGLEVAVTLERPGFRVKRRILRPSKVAFKHQIKKEESINFIKQIFNTEITK